MAKFKSKFRKAKDMPPTNTSNSIRGRISAPISIDEDEFPTRNLDSEAAISLRYEALDEQLPAPEPDIAEDAEIMSVIGPLELVRDTPATPVAASSVLEANVFKSTTHSSQIKDEDISDPSAISTEKPQRKKNSLKLVLGRIFGKKRKSEASSLNDSSKGKYREPGNGGDLSTFQSVNIYPKRPASVPISKYSIALPTLAEKTGLPKETYSQKRQSDEISRSIQLRRATTLGELYNSDHVAAYSSWDGLSPRPATSAAQGTENSRIGFAITKESLPKRRSRSLGQLRTTLGTTGELNRRKSDEIKFWRENNTDALSPISSQLADAESLHLLDQPPPMPELETHDFYKNPQPFNFGPMGEMAGMKITQAANLETRVLQLENRFRAMEKAISYLQRTTSRANMPLQNPQKDYAASSCSDLSRRATPEPSEYPQTPRKPSTIYQQPRFAQPDTGFQHQQDFDNSRPSTGTTQITAHHIPEDLYPHRLPQPNSQHTELRHRPLSPSTTVLSLHSSLVPQHGSLAAYHYARICSVIKEEQAARKHLEAQILTLQHQLHAVLSSHGSYPTPSPDLEAGDVEDEFETFSHAMGYTPSENEKYFDRDNFHMPKEDVNQYRSYADLNIETEDHGTSRTLSFSQMTLGPRSLCKIKP